MLTNQTRASLLQLLRSLSPSAVGLLLLKHLDLERPSLEDRHLLNAMSSSAPEQMAGLLVELLSGSTAIRTDAPTKYVFDARLQDLRSRLRADGFEVIENSLSRTLPAAESASQITDHFELALAGSSLDGDGAIRGLLRESYEGISSIQPDFNGSTTKARIALETIGRTSAAAIARRRNIAPPQDSWGAALHFLREQSVITRPAEDAIAKVYTLVSPGAHVPTGLTDEQWALLARTFTISAAYFLLKQHLATQG